MREVEQVWGKMMEKLHVAESQSRTAWQDIALSYSMPERHYHRLEHIGYMLAGLNEFGARLLMPIPVRLAAIYHDIRDTEEASARTAEKALTQMGLASAWCSAVSDLILCTKDHKPLPGILAGDSALLSDCDLLILAAAPARYDEYTLMVRREYPQYTDEQFREGRKQVMSGFATRDPIYFTAEVHDRFESRARANLEREIAAL